MRKGEMKLKLNSSARNRLILEILVTVAIVLMVLFPVKGKEYRRYATDTLHYVRAKVVEVVSQELEESSLGTGQQLGKQCLMVRLPDGTEVELNNYLTETHNILAAEGQTVIVCIDAPENAEAYYTVYNYDRIPALIGIVLVFILLLVAVGKRRGLDAFLAILFSLTFILCVTMPVLYNGGSSVLIGLVTVLLSTGVTLMLMHGPTKQCLLGIVTTLLGELAACVLFAVFSRWFHLTGFQTDSAEGLLLIAQNTGLDIRMLLAAGMMISSLGAVMDVAVSILGALREVAQASGKPQRAELFKSGIRLGRDLIGTMSNTLIFAFTGGALATMLVFYSYGVQPQQLLNSDYLTVEIAQGLCSTVAVILTVPFASSMGAMFYGQEKKRSRKKSRAKAR